MTRKLGVLLAIIVIAALLSTGCWARTPEVVEKEVVVTATPVPPTATPVAEEETVAVEEYGSVYDHEVAANDEWVVPAGWACKGDLQIKDANGEWNLRFDNADSTGGIVRFKESALVYAEWGANCVDEAWRDFESLKDEMFATGCKPQKGCSVVQKWTWPGSAKPTLFYRETEQARGVPGPATPAPADCDIVTGKWGANVREGPSTSWKVIGTMMTGTKFVPDGKLANGAWIHITSPYQGWVWRPNLNLCDLAALPVLPAPEPPAADHFVISPGETRDVPANWTCSGDIVINGDQKYDDDEKTALILYLTQAAAVKAPFGASCMAGDQRQYFRDRLPGKTLQQPDVWP